MLGTHHTGGDLVIWGGLVVYYSIVHVFKISKPEIEGSVGDI